MPSKTPNFDAAIEEILNELKPHKRFCKLRVPVPTLCPQCQFQRRLGYRINQLPIFYKKSCSVPGHDEKVISFYSDNNKFKIYDDDYYISDQWDALTFGGDFNFNKQFFNQFNELALSIPHQTLQRDYQSVNCEYTISGARSKS